MIILEDKANKENKHTRKNRYFADNQIEVMRVPLPVGDYIEMNDKVADVINRKEKRNLDLKKMDFIGTYTVSVDTKENMSEIVNNICGKQHARFRDECILAQNNGIQLFILVENEDNISSIDDVFRWHNPQLDIFVRDWNNPIGFYKNGNPRYGRKQKYPKATRGDRLAKSMLTMQKKYGVQFLFCKPSEAGAKVVELLGGLS